MIDSQPTATVFKMNQDIKLQSCKAQCLVSELESVVGLTHACDFTEFVESCEVGCDSSTHYPLDSASATVTCDGVSGKWDSFKGPFNYDFQVLPCKPPDKATFFRFF